jgi:GxxExxY protein
MEDKLIHGELSYELMGIIFNVHNELGGGMKEKYYQRAIEKALDEENIFYKSQITVPINYEDYNIGYYRPDFIIENKIVLEIKSGFGFSKGDLDQIYQYLRKTGYELGILVVFSEKKGYSHSSFKSI